MSPPIAGLLGALIGYIVGVFIGWWSQRPRWPALPRFPLPIGTKELMEDDDYLPEGFVLKRIIKDEKE